MENLIFLTSVILFSQSLNSFINLFIHPSIHSIKKYYFPLEKKIMVQMVRNIFLIKVL